MKKALILFLMGIIIYPQSFKGLSEYSDWSMEYPPNDGNIDIKTEQRYLYYKYDEDNIEYSYKTKYRKACRNCGENEIINKSQDLYDDITSSNDGTFHTYNVVPPYFHNGVMHILAEEKPEVVWKLKTKDNE